MSMDPQQPYQPQYAPAPTQGRWGTSTIGNLGAEAMSGISYVLNLLFILGFIGQIVIFAMEKNRFAKFHTAQAMVVNASAIVLWIISLVVNAALGFGMGSSSSLASAGSLGVAAIVNCVLGLVGLVLFVFVIWGMISAFTGKATKLPIFGSIAEGLAGGPVSSI